MKTLLVIGWIVFVIFVITYNFGARDDDNDEATVDQLLKDLNALKNKIATKAKNAVK